MEFNGSKTERNLFTAFQNEAVAHLKYLLYSEVAKSDGYEQIAEIFKYTANNELAHAGIWFKALGLLSSTKDNLEEAKASECFEHTKLYKEFKDVALKEGFDEIARLFDLVSNIEGEHEKRYMALLDNIESEKVFSKDSKVYWQCRNCGHIYEGKNAPKACPVCKHDEAYFQIYPENY